MKTILCKRDFTSFYKEPGSWGRENNEEQEPKEYQIGKVYNQPSERVELKEMFKNTIRKGESIDQDLIRSQYSIVHSPNVYALKNLKVRPHPVVACYCTAYSEHYPLIVSPDHIWMMITQGLVKHLAQRPELLNHSPQLSIGQAKKMDIVVEMPSYIDPTTGVIDWEGVVGEIHHGIINDVSQKGDEKKEKLIEFFDHNFSTSTSVEKIASKILMMEAFKDFYKYTNDFLCGLPSVTILGTIEDWLGMKEKLQLLDEYDMKWWRKVLTLILDKIIKTAQEEVLTEELKLFWNGIAVFDSSSGTDYISGWINYFFPYDKDNRISHPLSQFIEMDSKFDESCPYIENFEQGYLDECEGEAEEETLVKLFKWRQAIDLNYYPSPLATAPVQVLNHPQWKELTYISGFLGVDYDPILGGMQPLISWAIATKRNETIGKNITTRCKFDHAPWTISCGKNQWNASLSLTTSRCVPIISIDTNDKDIYSNSERMKEMFREIIQAVESEYVREEINLDEDVKFFSAKVVHLLAPSEAEASIVESAKECGLIVLNPICCDGESLIPYAFMDTVRGKDSIVVDWSNSNPFVGIYESTEYNYVEPITIGQSLEYTLEEDVCMFENALRQYIIKAMEPPKKTDFKRSPKIKYAILSGGNCNIPKVYEVIHKVISETLPGVEFVTPQIDLSLVQSAAGAQYFRYQYYEQLQYLESLKKMGYL